MVEAALRILSAPQYDSIWEGLAFAGLLPLLYYFLRLWYHGLGYDPDFLNFTTGVATLVALVSLLCFQSGWGQRLARRVNLSRLWQNAKRCCLTVWVIVGLLVIAFHWGYPWWAFLLFVAQAVKGSFYRRRFDMMGQTHLAGGVVLAITAEAVSQRMGFTLFDTAIGLDVTSGLTVAAAVGIAGIASLLPDLDHAKSKASNLNIVTRLISAVVRSVTKHRSGTHWFLTCLVLTGIIYFVWPSLAIWFFIGYASHLLLDMMTISGVKVLRPFSSRTYYLLPKFMRFRTGGWPEIGFRFLCWVVAVLLFTWQVSELL